MSGQGEYGGSETDYNGPFDQTAENRDRCCVGSDRGRVVTSGCSLYLAQDIASGLGIHPNEAAKQVDRLISEGKVRTTRHDGILYCESTP